MLLERPAAISSLPAEKRRPALVSTLTPGPGTSITRSTSSSKTSSMPIERKRASRRSRSSSSRKPSSLELDSSSVTLTPRQAKIEAYSEPITPPPTTVSVSGMRSSSRIVSESTTSGSSKGMPSGRRGRLPVAIRILSALTLRCPSSSSVCASTKLALPCTISTFTLRRRSVTSSISFWITRFLRASSSATVICSRLSPRSTPSSPRWLKPERCSAVSRSVFEGSVPVLMPAPPMSFRRSISATFFPRRPASTAAMAPAGPEPMTARS